MKQIIVISYFIVIYDEVNDDDLLPSGTSFIALVDLFSDEVVRTSDG